MSESRYLAVDLGAESCRACLVSFDGRRVELEERHRFPNGAVNVLGGLYWDALGIHRGILEALASSASDVPVSIGIDSWAVDFGLLGADGELLANPRSHRDPRTDGLVEYVTERVGAERLYEKTGIQLNRINTLYQLVALRDTDLLGAASRLLLMPDLFTYFLTGEQITEYTNATATQVYDQVSDRWDSDLLEKLGLPERILGEVIPPGTRTGTLRKEVSESSGMDRSTPLVSVASHDTASAVVSLPVENDDIAYISSGTWSLVGVETDGIVTTERARRENFTNEGGFAGRNRFLKNIMGLWILQECRRAWSRGGSAPDYETLQVEAEDAGSARSLIDPNDPDFFEPGDMVGRIKEYCSVTDQAIPETRGETVRCIFDSLAIAYAETISSAAEISGRAVETVHVVGGGSQNDLLCRLTANATGLPVVAGPVEATILGNGLVQAYAAGEVSDLSEIREVVRRSFILERFEPDDGSDLAAEGRERIARIRARREEHLRRTEG